MSAFAQHDLSPRARRNPSLIRLLGIAVGLTALVVLLAAAVLLSARNNTAAQPVDPVAALLQQNRQKWEALPGNRYAYTLQVSCFCVQEYTQPVRIVVENGAVIAVTAVATGESLDPALYEPYLGAERLFDLVASATAEQAAYLDVQYDSLTGLPTSIGIDRSLQIADEEIYLTIGEIERLP